MKQSRERELYLTETMLHQLSDETLIGLLASFALAMQEAGLLSDVQRRRIRKLVGETFLQSKSEAA